jgi:glutamate-5-semialdehyde dehydrogenase
MIDAIGERARAAARRLALTTTESKNAALFAMAARLEEAADAVLEANGDDVTRAEQEGISNSLLDRLRLDGSRLEGMAAGLRSVAALPDPVGEVTAGWRLANGLDIARIRVPLGVVAVIYEARPNVTVDAAGLCLKSGNAALLRGSSTALRSNMAIGSALRAGLADADIPEDAVQVLEDTSREGARELLRAKRWVDLLVPRGGPGLLAQIEAEATVPVVVDGAGNCHVYVDAAADLDQAVSIVVNAKTHRPGVCNAAEKLLVHQSVAPEFLPRVAKELSDAGVELRGDPAAMAIIAEMAPASDEDWDTEYLDLVMAVRVVPDLGTAVEHVLAHGTGHTEAIVTQDISAADAFVDGTDSAVVMVNASTRFTDGEQFGFGGEIGISTQKLHTRGPMGLSALTSERYVVRGDGQVRQ